MADCQTAVLVPVPLQRFSAGPNQLLCVFDFGFVGFGGCWLVSYLERVNVVIWEIGDRLLLAEPYLRMRKLSICDTELT